MKLTDIITASTIRNCVRDHAPVETSTLADCDLETIHDSDGIEIHNVRRNGDLIGSIEDDGNGFEWCEGADGRDSATLEDV